MISVFFLIMLCWSIDMPLWLSITGTILASIDLFSECTIKILNIKENNEKWKKIK